MQTQPTLLVDGVSAIAIHNGVARIQFMRIGLDGRPINSHEIMIPISAVTSIIEALQKVPNASGSNESKSQRGRK
jgi:hypothetical protein